MGVREAAKFRARSFRGAAQITALTVHSLRVFINAFNRVLGSHGAISARATNRLTVGLSVASVAEVSIEISVPSVCSFKACKFDLIYGAECKGEGKARFN